MKIFLSFISGLVLSSAVIFYAAPNISRYIDAPLQLEKTEELPELPTVGVPVRLNIPKINVSSLFEYVGLTADGSMDVPKNPKSVAWFAPGRRPGEIGSAVVAGHYGWKNGKESVFDNLHELKAGDSIFIEDEMGATIAFVVRESRKYDPKADATLVFSSSDGKAHLNLVTCEGVWDKSSKSYSKRLVIFADRVE